jgi:hypothetical protein
MWLEMHHFIQIHFRRFSHITEVHHDALLSTASLVDLEAYDSVCPSRADFYICCSVQVIPHTLLLWLLILYVNRPETLQYLTMYYFVACYVYVRYTYVCMHANVWNNESPLSLAENSIFWRNINIYDFINICLRLDHNLIFTSYKVNIVRFNYCHYLFICDH